MPPGLGGYGPGFPSEPAENRSGGYVFGLPRRSLGGGGACRTTAEPDLFEAGRTSPGVEHDATIPAPQWAATHSDSADFPLAAYLRFAA